MELFPKFTIFCKITLAFLFLLNVAVAAEENPPLETLLSQDVAIVASLNQMGNSLDALRSSKLFETLAAIHQEEHPDKPALPAEAEKVLKHPFIQLIKDKLVLGLIPPPKQGEHPGFIVVCKGDQNLAENIENVLKEEEGKQKLYRLSSQEYLGQKILVCLQSEHNKLQQRFLLVGNGIFIASNSLENVKDSYARFIGQKQDGLVLPEVYQKLDGRSLIKVCVILEKIKMDLEKMHKNPLEEYPEMARFFGNIRDSIKNTKYLAASVVVENGVNIQILRERKPETPVLLPVLSFPQKLINENTIAFVSVPVPYSVFWYGAKHHASRREPRKAREIEARLDEFFQWMSFEKDVVPQIGPQTSILIQNPDNKEGEVVPPHVNLMIQISPGVDFSAAVKKLWEIAKKDGKITEHINHSIQDVEGVALARIQFKKHPFDKLVSPAYSFLPNWFIVGSDARTVANLIPLLKSKESRNEHIYAYLNFQSLANLIETNLPFLQKEAEKKNKPFEGKKARNFLSLLRYFQTATLAMKNSEALEIVDISIKVK